MKKILCISGSPVKNSNQMMQEMRPMMDKGMRQWRETELAQANMETKNK